MSARTTPQSLGGLPAGLLQKDSCIGHREREKETDRERKFHKQLPDLSAQVSLHLVSQEQIAQPTLIIPEERPGKRLDSDLPLA